MIGNREIDGSQPTVALHRSAKAAAAWATLLLAVLVVALAMPAGATALLKRLSLTEVIERAARIVHATVVEVRSGRDEWGAPATWITLDVAATIKGSVGRRLTIKQFGVAEPLGDGRIARVAGLPRYAPGDEVVLFLRGDSARGFTSPVGLTQGVYRVRLVDGKRTAHGDLPGKGQPLDEFLAAVATLATPGP